MQKKNKAPTHSVKVMHCTAYRNTIRHFTDPEHNRVRTATEQEQEVYVCVCVCAHECFCVYKRKTHLRAPHTALDRNRFSVAEPEQEFRSRGAAAGVESRRDRGQQRSTHMEKKKKEKKPRQEGGGKQKREEEKHVNTSRSDSTQCKGCFMWVHW